MKIRFKDCVTSTQSVLFCPTNPISLSKMSRVCIWTRGLCILIFSCKYLKAPGPLPLWGPKAWIHLQGSDFSSLWVGHCLPTAPVYSTARTAAVLILVLSAFFYLCLVFPIVNPSTKMTSPLWLQGNSFSPKRGKKKSKPGVVQQQRRMPLIRACQSTPHLLPQLRVTPLPMKVSLHATWRYCKLGTR